MSPTNDVVLPPGDPADWRPEERVNFHLVMTIGHAFLALNFLGCVYVFYRVFARWRISAAGEMSMPMSLRLPFYTVITDFLICTIASINLTYTTVNHKTLKGDNCLVMGALTFGAAILNISLYGSIAILTYLRVCREIYLDFGRYDHRLWALVLGLTICLTFAGFGAYGEQKYWCTSKLNTTRPGFIMFSAILAIIILVFMCYLLTLRDIRQIDRRTLYGTAAIAGAVIERRVARKFASYILVFLIQWVPVTIYDLCREIGNMDRVWIYLLCIIGANLGGVGTAIQFVLNEGWNAQRAMTIHTVYAPTPIIISSPLPTKEIYTYDASTLPAVAPVVLRDRMKSGD